LDDIRCYWPSAVEAVAGSLRDRVGERARVGVVGSLQAIPYGQWHAVQEALPGVEFVDVTRALNEHRWIRSPEEVERLRISGRIMEEACDAIVARLRPGMTELDAKAIVHSVLHPYGAEEGITYLAATSMAEPDRRSPWQFPTHRPVHDGDVLISEITINYFGYGAQVHRPFAIGRPPGPIHQGLFDVAVECFDAVRAVLRDGATSEQVVAAGEVVAARGYRLFDSLLHGEMGRSPELGASGSEHAFEPWTFRTGQMVVLQPNPVTTDGSAGLQAGCALLVEDDGATPLHGWPLRFPVCTGQGRRTRSRLAPSNAH
ncbi:MAG: M24 family metallopeptidase, partial [Microbacteriaceae bacterium]|nr:M24 family metallopeptidase [Microbacteriaceae bacterium]